MTTLTVLSIPEPCHAGDDDVRRCATVAAQGGVEITLLLPIGVTAYGAEAHGIRVLTEPVRRGSVIPMAPSLRGGTYPRLGAILRRMRPDVIHLDASPRGALAHAVARLRGDAALVLECEDQAAPAPKLLPGWALRLAERRVLRAADFVLARHYDVLNWARGQGFSGPGAVVAYGMCAVSPPLDGAGADRAPGLTLGYVGALSRESGVVDLVEAVAACRAPVSLTILGQGPLHDEVTDRAAALRVGDRVSVLGMSAGGLAESLRSADVAVLTARHGGCEPVDRRIAEVQALGIPVIAFGVPGGRELVGDAGWYVAEGDAGLLSRLLRRLAAHPEEVVRARAACIPHVQWRASLDTVGADLARAFVQAKQRRAGSEVVADVPLAASHGVKL